MSHSHLANLATKVMSLDQAVKRCATMISGGAGGVTLDEKVGFIGGSEEKTS